MADLSHLVGGDLSIALGGDLAVVDRSDETKQRVLRRLLTSKGSYIWQLTYGAGLPALVGQVTSEQQIAAIIKSQMMLEAGVSPTPEPLVRVDVGALGSVSAVITYFDADTASTQTLSLSTGG